MAHFDLVVIGSGPAGEKGAAQAAYFGKRVAVVEKRPVLGGARIHACALPSKNLRETALSLSGLKQREAHGVSVKVDPRANLSDLLCRDATIVDAEVERVRRNLEAHRVTVVAGHARFLDAHTVAVDGEGGSERLSADVFLIATGSTPHRPAEMPWHHPALLDSDGIMQLDRLPESLTVIGGGVIGCELASMFAPLGVRVALIDRAERLLTFADGEVSAILAEAFRNLGIDVRQGARDVVIAETDGGLATRLGDGEPLASELVLVCAGRIGNTAGLGLDAAGVRTDERDRILVDASYRTTAPHVYAAGDVIGFPALASTSMEQARVAMCHAFDLEYKTRLSPILPLGIYTIPELSMVGATEEHARQRGIDYQIGRALYRDNARGRIAGDSDGMLKLVFARGDRRLLGAHIVGERATELIHVASTCLLLGGTIDVFIDAVYNYPTLSELYKYAAYDGLGRLARTT